MEATRRRPLPLSPEQVETIGRIARANKLALVVLFGSRAKGRARDNSDWDFAVTPDPGRRLTMEEEGRLEAEFAQTGLDRVEVRGLWGASPLFQIEVYRSGMVVYAKDDRVWPLFRLYAAKTLRDTEKFRIARHRVAMRILERLLQ